jgi:hypothetical protein
MQQQKGLIILVIEGPSLLWNFVCKSIRTSFSLAMEFRMQVLSGSEKPLRATGHHYTIIPLHHNSVATMKEVSERIDIHYNCSIYCTFNSLTVHCQLYWTVVLSISVLLEHI